MKTTTTPAIASFFSALLCAASVQAQNPVPNASFENWSNGNPVGWVTSNGPFSGTPITQNTTGHTGSKAARGTFTSLVESPVLNLLNASNLPVAISQAYEHFTFYYQLQLNSTAGSEAFVASAQFNDVNYSPTGAASQYFERVSNTSTWTFADLPINNFAPNPTGMTISFSLAGSDAVAGSFFVVDDVAVTNGPAGVAELEQGATLGVAWPVPATDELNLPFSLDRSATVVLDVLDALGRTMSHEVIGTLGAGRYKQVLEVQGWAAGSYTAVLRTGTGVHAQRFAVVH